MVEGVRSEELRQFAVVRHDMLAYRNESSARAQHAGNLAAQGVQVAGMVQHRATEHDIERRIGKGQRFAPFLHHVDFDPGLTRQRPDCAGSDIVAGVRLQRGYRPPVPRQRVRSDAPTRPDIERGATRIGQFPPDRGPFGAGVIAPCRVDQRIVIETRPHELPVPRIVAQRSNGLFPCQVRVGHAKHLSGNRV